jgi:hypothetical protein
VIRQRLEKYSGQTKVQWTSEPASKCVSVSQKMTLPCLLSV